MKGRGLMLLCLALLMLPALGCAETRTVENEKLSLTIDGESMRITVTEKAGGGTLLGCANTEGIEAGTSWQGFLNAMLAIDLSKGTTQNTERVDAVSAQTEITCSFVENGADFTVDFTEKCQKITLRLRLEEDSIVISVPAGGIEEYGESRLCGLYLLPCFGATHLTEREGYMFIPEAAGAIMRLTDGAGLGNTPFTKRVYGPNAGVTSQVHMELNRDPEAITMPVYGMAYTDTGLGFLAVIEKGAETAEIMAYPGGVITEFNWIGAHFLVREAYFRQTSRATRFMSREVTGYGEEMAVRFYILSGQEASYSGMAARWRRALEDAGRLKKGDTTYRPCIELLGAESEKFLLWNRVVPVTTAKQALEIVNAYSQAGLNKPLVVYTGWQSGGLTANYGSGRIGMEGSLGTLADMDALKGRVEELGGIFLPEQELLLANPELAYDNRSDLVRMLGQTLAQFSTGMERYKSLYYLSPARSGEILSDYVRAYGERFGGVSLSTLPHVLFSRYVSGQKNATRTDTLRAYQAMMEELDGLTVALSNPLAEYYADTDVYLDLPLNVTNYNFIAAQVPFLPLVLSGAIPYYAVPANEEANAHRQLMRTLEYGAYAAYQITGDDVQELAGTNSCDLFTARWDLMMEPAMARFSALWEVYQDLDGERLIDHRLISDQVALSRWSDGTEILFNYGVQPFRYRETEVGPESYAVLPKGGDAP